MSKNRVDILIAAKDQASRQMNTIAKSAVGMAGTIKAAAVGALAYFGGRAMISHVRESVRLYASQEQAERKLAQVLYTTGGAAGYSARELIDHASALQRVTTYGDDAIIEAEALLATFTQVNDQVFRDATELALDMSVVLGQDLKSSIVQLGKALNDPVRGATALRRVGVSLTAQQMDQIKTLVEQNRLYEAQRVILDELKTEFGGQARAAAGGTGAFVQMANAVSDVREQFARGLMPMLTEAAQSITTWAETHKTQIYAAAYKTGSYLLLIKDDFVEIINYLKTDFKGGSQWAMDSFLKILRAGFESAYELAVIGGKGIIRGINEGITGMREKTIAAAAEKHYAENFTTFGRKPWVYKDRVDGEGRIMSVSNTAYRTPADHDLYRDIYEYEKSQYDKRLKDDIFGGLADNLKLTWADAMKEIADSAPKELAVTFDEAWAKHQARLAAMAPTDPIAAGKGTYTPSAAGFAAAAAGGGKGSGSNVFESLLMAGAPGQAAQYDKATAEHTRRTNEQLRLLNQTMSRMLQMMHVPHAATVFTMR